MGKLNTLQIKQNIEIMSQIIFSGCGVVYVIHLFFQMVELHVMCSSAQTLNVKHATFIYIENKCIRSRNLKEKYGFKRHCMHVERNSTPLVLEWKK